MRVPVAEPCRISLSLTLALTLLPTVAASAADPQSSDLEFFEKRIRPVLVRHCYACHSALTAEPKGGLRLDSREALRKGGESGPAVTPGKADDSLLLSAIKHEDYKMPPDKRLPARVIADFESWIRRGAIDPRDRPPSALEIADLSWRKKLAQRRDWWSLKPLKAARPPNVQAARWSRTPIDRFLAARLEAAGLPIGPPAEPQTLIRRATLLLTGLPPRPDAVKRFVRAAPAAPDRAYEQLIDRLLQSPHFGERWARHWMDIVRFAETHGYEWNHEIRDAWRYRDYLIRALNADVPYDQLLREHIAGDLLENPRVDRAAARNESLIGTAFWRFGELGHDNCVRFPEIRFDALDNQIDTLTKAFQASTVSCARCHDHKLDPFSTRDYYGLVGILESSRQVIRTIDTPDRYRRHFADLQRLKKQIRQVTAKRWEAALPEVVRQITAALPLAEGDKTVPEGGKQTALAKQLTAAKVSQTSPVVVLRALRKAGPPSIAARWRALASQIHQEREKHRAENAKRYRVWSSLRSLASDGWRWEGTGSAKRFAKAGAFVVALEGERAITRLLPAGRYTHLLSSRMNGTLQSPWAPTSHKYVSLRFDGGGLSLIRAVINSCALNEFVGGGLKYIEPSGPRWMTFPTAASPQHRSFFELTTKSDNPRWPDRPGRAGDKKSLLTSPHSWFGLTRVVLHDTPQPPQPEFDLLAKLLTCEPPESPAEVAARLARVTGQAIARWRVDRATDLDADWLQWLLDTELLPNDLAPAPLRDLVHAYRQRERLLPAPRVVAGMADQGPGFDSPVLLRGNPEQPGPRQPRGYVEVLSPHGSGDSTGRATSRRSVVSGSGRRLLAARIASPRNPLTARVLVNRLWHHLMGSGLVRTPDDFGRLGERPSHPELLDYLAQRLIDDGWSVKRSLRRIVLSQAFRQSARPPDRAREVDPANRLLHHFPVRRLDAEAIRDSLLAVSGRLDRTRFGASIHPFRAEPKPHRKLESGPLDGNGRRSLYLKVTRMEGPRFLELFDLPDQMATRGRRDRSSVPAQALALLNDPFLIDQARVWGRRLVRRPDTSAAARIDHMFWRAFARPPRTAERDRLLGLVNRLAELHGVPPANRLTSETLWKDVAHTLFNMKEFIYVR